MKQDMMDFIFIGRLASYDNLQVVFIIFDAILSLPEICEYCDELVYIRKVRTAFSGSIVAELYSY